MHIENPKLDEVKNPNISHESVTKELSHLLLQLGLLIVAILVFVRAIAWGIGQYLPYKYEEKWFSQIGKSITKDTQTNATLQRLATQLSQKIPLPKDAQIKVHIFPEKEIINAYATFGGNIVLMQGLMENAPSEQALSMVLAHEIAHIAHRDPIKALSQGALLQVLRSTIFGQQTVIDSGLIFSTLSYSREQETNADKAALDAVYSHYGSIAGAIEMFSFLESANNDGTPTRDWLPNWLSTHPDTQIRQETLRAYARQKGYTSNGEIISNPWKTK